MSDKSAVVVTLPADVQQIDQTGNVWAFLDTATALDRVQAGTLIVAGDVEEPFLARVIDIVDGPAVGRSCTSTWSVCPTRRSTSCATPTCCRSSSRPGRRVP